MKIVKKQDLSQWTLIMCQVWSKSREGMMDRPMVALVYSLTTLLERGNNKTDNDLPIDRIEAGPPPSHLLWDTLCDCVASCNWDKILFPFLIDDAFTSNT